MVLNTSPKTVLEGMANPGGTLAVKINEYVRLAEADNNGNWKVEFPKIILDEPFSIEFAGKDTSFKIDNIQTGSLVILAGDGNLSVLPLEEPKSIAPPTTTQARIFIPEPTLNSQPQELFTGGIWLSIDEYLQKKKSSPLIVDLVRMLSDYENPIGIIDLSWAGSHIESWIPNEDKLAENNTAVSKNYSNSFLQINDSVADQILAMRDTCREAIAGGVTRTWYNDEYWKITDLPAVIAIKDDFEKKRLVYLRKKIYVSSAYLTSDFYINLEHVHGPAQYFFNETLIIPQQNSYQKTTLVIPDSLMKVWSNVLTIRLFCKDSMSGFYGSEYVCYNADSSYYRSIDSEWKYTFNAESEFPQLLPIESEYGLAYNSLLSRAIKLNSDAIIFHFRNITINQTSQLLKKVGTLNKLLPESCDKLFSYQTISFTDTLIYEINGFDFDSKIQLLADSCGFTPFEIK